MKIVEKQREAIEKAASGVDILEIFRGGSDEPVIELAKTAPFIAQALIPFTIETLWKDVVHICFQSIFADLRMVCAPNADAR